jgi:tungstate transport system ATP-binding protein
MSGVTAYRGPRKVLDIERFILNQGEMVSILGPNGAGKSTLLQVVNTLLPYRSGTLRLFGRDVVPAEALAIRRRSALLFQEPLFITDTVFNNVALPLRIRRVSESCVREKVVKALRMMRCEHLAERSAHSLSGGEAQRINLARAFVIEPELLLLDEPFSSLDAVTRSALLREFRQIVEDQGIAVLLVSHSIHDILFLSERTIVLQDGYIIQDDKPELIMRRPANEAIARLTGMENIIRCHVKTTQEGREIQLNDKVRFPYRRRVPATASACCLPGDCLRILGEDDQLPDYYVTMEGIVRRIIPGIGVYQIIVEADNLTLNLQLPRDEANAVCGPGCPVRVAFYPDDAQIV